jgi:hypothetical protein
MPRWQIRKPARETPGRHPPTREEALDSFRSMKGAALVIERVSGLGNISAWGEVAFWSPHRTTGAALHGGPLCWDCDLLGWDDLAFTDANNFVRFWGSDYVSVPPGPPVTPPPGLDGQIWCELEVSAPGFHLFSVNVSIGVGDGDGENTALIECGVDDYSLGETQLADLPYGKYPVFIVKLPHGVHRFYIKRLDGTIDFWSATAWRIPISGAAAA